MKLAKIAYKPVGLALGAVSGLVAGAAVDRGGATATQRLTGVRPG
ncbi:hypothetical protein [Streptacidiphilus sp. PAMC 29251]